MIAVCAGRRDLNVPDTLICEAHGMRLAQAGWIVRTGGAPGADQAFGLGVLAAGSDWSKLELFLPWPGFEARSVPPEISVRYVSQVDAAAVDLALRARPDLGGYRESVQKLFLRSAMALIGAQVLYAWPDRSKPRWGGTGFSIDAARLLELPVILFPDGERL